MSNFRIGAAYAAVAVFAALLVVGAPLAALALKEEVTGKVTAFEKEKSITVEVGGAQKEIKLSEKTKSEGEVAVGKTVVVTVEDGVATKVVVKE